MTDDPVPKTPGDGGYADVRERLIGMGYLGRPLERYVLGGVARPGSFLRRHAAVSLRVALAVGPLLGLVFALAVVVANSPRFSHARDFLVLGGAFTLAFGATVFVLELGAGTLLAALARWRGRGVAAFPATAMRAGFLVSLALSAYLAYWWRRRTGGDASLAIDLGGLAVLVLVNAALLRVSSLASLAALVRVSDLPGPATRTGRSVAGDPAAHEGTVRRARLLAPACLAAVLLITGFFVAPRSRSRHVASPYTRVPAQGRMVVIAWDGVPAEVCDWRASGGDAPVRHEVFPGRPCARIPVAKPSLQMLASPASLWTAAATGRRENGVDALQEERPVGLSSPMGGNVPFGDVLLAMLPGREVAVSAGVRTARTLWEILHDHEGVGCIGWWATWPAAERGSGDLPFDLVTDRAVLALRRPTAGKLLIAPPSLERRLIAEFDADVADLRASHRESGETAGEENRADLEQAALIDGYAASLAMKVLADERVRDLFVYLPGVDIARVAVARRTPDRADRFVWRYSQYAWGQVQRIERVLKPEDTLIVIATPGRRDPLGARQALRDSRPEPRGPERSGWNAEEAGAEVQTKPSEEQSGDAGARPSVPPSATPWGWLLVGAPAPPRGPGVPVAVTAGTEIDLLDVAPTLLNLRGFPRSREMDGRSRAYSQGARPAEIDSYGRNTIPSIPFSSSNDDQERETLERLRSLGYLN